MSSEMSEPEPSNPFEKLSDDPILHICSFLRGKDLLKLSTVDKNFKRIVTESTETMRKIPLVLSFERHKELDLDFANKLAQTRRFTALRLKHVSLLTDANAEVKLISLLGLLTGSVEDFAVEGKISHELLSSIIASFLPNLKKCELYHVTFDAEVAPIIEGIGPRSSVNHSLESLELIETPAAQVLQLFTGCNQLKTFCNDEPYRGATTKDIEHVNNFLASQDRLKKLYYDGEGLAWDRLICFKLKELTVGPLPDKDDQIAAAEFLKKLPSLAKLDIGVTNHPSRRLMRAICQVPKLEKFSIQAWRCQLEDENEDSLEGLANLTVKELRGMDLPGIMSKLLKIFLGVESIYLNLNTVLDLSDVPCETIMKIKPNNDYFGDGFAVKFSPSDLPTNVEQFESAVMKFAGEFSTDIVGIVIGHESWRNCGDFRLSNSFCEDLVNRLSYLDTLKMYNIADRGRFVAFLSENQDRLNLEEVKLYKPFGVGEPKPKKMKINFD